MHRVVGFNVLAILTVCLPLLLSALKMQVNAHGDVNSFHRSSHVLRRWKRASTGNPATCSEQKMVDDRVRSMSNVTRKLFADEVEFTGDNKFTLQMSWTGSDTERIIVVTSEGGMSTVYLSDETSKRFDNISSRLQEATVNYRLSLQKHPLVSETVYIVANPSFGPSSLYISNDAGNTFNKVALPFLVLGSLVFHPSDSELILLDDRRRHELYLSKNRGATWSKIKSNHQFQVEYSTKFIKHICHHWRILYIF